MIGRHLVRTCDLHMLQCALFGAAVALMDLFEGLLIAGVRLVGEKMIYTWCGVC